MHGYTSRIFLNELCRIDDGFRIGLDNIYIDRFRLIKIGEFWIVENMVDLGENYIFAEKAFSLWILWTSYIVSMMEFELALDNIYADRFRLIKIGEFWIVENMVDLGENYIFAEKVFSNKKLSVSWILWTRYVVSMIKFELALDNIYIDRFRLIKYDWSRRKLYFRKKVFSSKKLITSWARYHEFYEGIILMMEFELALDNI